MSQKNQYLTAMGIPLWLPVNTEQSNEADLPASRLTILIEPKDDAKALLAHPIVLSVLMELELRVSDCNVMTSDQKELLYDKTMLWDMTLRPNRLQAEGGHSGSQAIAAGLANPSKLILTPEISCLMEGSVHKRQLWQQVTLLKDQLDCRK